MDDAPPAKRQKLTVSREVEEVDAVVGSSLAAIDVNSNEAYFSTIFKSVCNFFLSEDSPEKHVFSELDIGIIQSFMDLPGSQQQLYIRLLLRKRQWFRVSKISYVQIAQDLTPIVYSLVEKELLHSEVSMTDHRDALNLLQLPELKTLCKDLKVPTSVVQKADIIQWLDRHARQHRPLFGSSSFKDVLLGRVKSILGRCVSVVTGPAEVFSKCLMLYSLTTSLSYSWREERSLSDIIFQLLQVGKHQVAYPEYSVYVTRPLFETRQSFNRFYDATQNLQKFLTAAENKDHHLALLLMKMAKESFEEVIQCPGSEEQLYPTMPAFTERFTAGWVLARTLSHCVEYLEKRGEYQQANSMLKLLLSQKSVAVTYRGRWFDRLALNLDYHLGDKNGCIKVIKDALEEGNIHPARQLSLLQRAHKLCQSVRKSKGKKGGKHIVPQHCSMSDFPPLHLQTAPEICIEAKQYHADNKVVYAKASQENPESCNFLSVEGFAMDYYNTVKGWPHTVHAEKSTFTLMFSLLMWDVIFSSGVPDVFRTSLQDGPLDLFTNDFYTGRKEMIEHRLHWMKSACHEELGKAIDVCWETNYGKECIGIVWDILPSVEDVKALASCMGGTLLSLICKEFALSYGPSCGGLPDLTLWNPQSNLCKFVEVKGPGDQLSHKQLVWLSRLLSWGCQVEVCRVRGS